MAEQRHCEWITFREALRAFVLNTSGHQGQSHIRPLHHYVACRLVVEGGFNPEDITPRPPFTVRLQQGRRILIHDPASAGSGERTVLGGLKTKAVDVVVTKPGIGPVMAVSMKGTLGAFRNLTNRMEEAIGDCTNLHISYPALVYGFLQILRATKPGERVPANDVCLTPEGMPTESIVRYHDVIARLDGREDLREESTKYEAVGLALVIPTGSDQGLVLPTFPSLDSPLSITSFFPRLYRAYDLRFVFAAPQLKSVTARHVWAEDSPAFAGRTFDEYQPRVGDEPEPEAESDE
ncbi:MAG: hypothetical protein KF705_12710 [Phycisphaeraceae bacterium]|nr:hypothetical protein [Phycisphaeraceae bacterium]